VFTPNFPGDLKPENIIFDGKTLKLADFGLSSIVKDCGENSDEWKSIESVSVDGIGTPTYASPEQLSGASPDFSSDIYSLGVILFELLSCFSTEMERFDSIKRFKQGLVDASSPSFQILVRSTIFSPWN
jgi:serine/threonine protein kinase